jgi:hypothetical protein
VGTVENSLTSSTSSGGTRLIGHRIFRVVTGYGENVVQVWKDGSHGCGMLFILDVALSTQMRLVLPCCQWNYQLHYSRSGRDRFQRLKIVYLVKSITLIKNWSVKKNQLTRPRTESIPEIWCDIRVIVWGQHEKVVRDWLCGDSLGHLRSRRGNGARSQHHLQRSYLHVERWRSRRSFVGRQRYRCSTANLNWDPVGCQ